MGIPSLSDNDRFRVYREAVLNRVEVALMGVPHEVFVTAPTQAQGLPGIVEAQNRDFTTRIAGRFLACVACSGRRGGACGWFCRSFSG